MGSLLGIIVETRGETDWSFVPEGELEVLAPEPGGDFAWVDVPPTLFTIGDQEGLRGFARAASAHLGGRAVALAAQTVGSAQWVEAFEDGASVREIAYEDGTWSLRGTPQDWEQAYFFADADTDWPDLFFGETDEELERFRQAAASGDVEQALDVMYGSSLGALERLVASFGVHWTEPAARWVPPSQRRGAWTTWLVLGAILVFFVGACLAGALTA